VRNAPVDDRCRGYSLPRMIPRLRNSAVWKYEGRSDAPAEPGRFWIGPVRKKQIEQLYVREFCDRGAITPRNRQRLHLEGWPNDLLERQKWKGSIGTTSFRLISLSWAGVLKFSGVY